MIYIARVVCSLWEDFCVSLHDQMKHRVYFYKAAPLVRLENELGGREGGRKEGRERGRER